MMITSQCYSGLEPTSVSIAVRECQVGGAGPLHGNHQPHDCKGKLLLCADITEPLQRGGTAIYACLIRDANDPSVWTFRNTIDLSLGSMTHVASQVTQASREIFTELFHNKANMSTRDINRVGHVRLCQIYEAAMANKRSPREVRVIATGAKKREPKATAEDFKFQGAYMANLEAATAVRKNFSSKAVDINESLELALKACGGKLPCAILRVGMNSLVPTEVLASVRERAGGTLPYASIDGRGHLFKALETLPKEGALFLPGQVESCVTLLRNLLEGPAAEVGGHAALIRYVNEFLPREDVQPVEGQQEEADEETRP